jgi:hypothetical protein
VLRVDASRSSSSSSNGRECSNISTICVEVQAGVSTDTCKLTLADEVVSGLQLTGSCLASTVTESHCGGLAGVLYSRGDGTAIQLGRA